VCMCYIWFVLATCSQFSVIPKKYKVLFSYLPSLRGIHKKDDHKHFRGGEYDDNLFPPFFLIVSFFPSIPSILIPLRLCEPVDQRLIVNIWSKRFDCTCAGPSLEIPSPCSVPACCLRFMFHFRTWCGLPGTPTLACFSKSTLSRNWATAEPTLLRNHSQCAEICLNFKKNRRC